jgi:hypothetical protein
MMGKPKRKLTAEQRRRRRERKKNFRMTFINGKQKWVRREPMIDGMPVDEFIARNADPIWLHQEGLWHLMPVDEGLTVEELDQPLPMGGADSPGSAIKGCASGEDSDEVPF